MIPSHECGQREGQLDILMHPQREAGGGTATGKHGDKDIRFT